MPELVNDRIVATEAAALRAMFKARKEVFVDLLGWELSVIGGEFEIDQFDDESADYLVLVDLDGAHRASTRLLRTEQEHLLGGVYPHLCAGRVPTGPTVREITRFCLDRHQRATERRSARNQLVTALSSHAAQTGITSYTGVAEVEWFEQIRQFGWACDALGQPVRHGGTWLVGLHIFIRPDTADRLASRGFYQAAALTLRAPKFGSLVQ